jgi:hypothetical protein
MAAIRTKARRVRCFKCFIFYFLRFNDIKIKK